MIKLFAVAALLAIGLAGSAKAQDDWKSPVVAAQMVQAQKSFGEVG